LDIEGEVMSFKMGRVNAKQTSRPNKEERKFLRAQGFNPKYFLWLSTTADGYEFLEVQTGKILSIRR
jgi:hypothetical protein